MVMIDVTIIILYLVALVLIGAIVSKGVKTHEDSVVGGRAFGTFLAAIGRAANLAGASTSVGGAGYGYAYGVSGAWYGIMGALSTAVWSPLTPRLWRAMTRGGFTTIGDYIGYRFGKPAKIISGLLNSFAYMGFVAAQIVGTGTILTVLLGWDYKLAMLVTTAVVIAYTVLGGLKAVVYTDIMQMAILYVGLVFILPAIAVGEAGGMAQLLDTIPEAFRQMGYMGWPIIIGVIGIPGMLMPLTMQATYIYAASCNSNKAAWQSTVLSSILYFIPAMAVIIIGLCALALFPGLASSNDALPTIIVELLPNGAIGLLIAAILSATMSTSSTCLICSTNCFLTDVMGALSKKVRTGEEQLKVTRIGMCVVGVLTLGITMFYSDILGIILLGYALGVGGLLAPAFAAMFWKRATTPGCLAAMIAGGGSYIFIQLTHIVTWPPIFFSLPISLLAIIIVSFATKPSDPSVYDVYFEDEWQKSPKNTEKTA